MYGEAEGLYQPMIIWTNLVYLLVSPILYTKIQPKHFLGSGEEDF